MSEKHACTTCGQTDPAQCHAGEFCAWDGEKAAQPPEGQPALVKAENTDGPILTSQPARRGKKGLFLLAAAGLAGLVALKACEDEPQAPAPQPTPAPAPVDPVPQAFQLWILEDSHPLCQEGTITELSCISSFRLAAGSCVQPFTDYNGDNRGQFVHVSATFEDGSPHDGMIDRSLMRRAPASMTERDCIARLDR